MGSNFYFVNSWSRSSRFWRTYFLDQISAIIFILLHNGPICKRSGGHSECVHDLFPICSNISQQSSSPLGSQYRRIPDCRNSDGVGSGHFAAHRLEGSSGRRRSSSVVFANRSHCGFRVAQRSRFGLGSAHYEGGPSTVWTQRPRSRLGLASVCSASWFLLLFEFFALFLLYLTPQVTL